MFHYSLKNYERKKIYLNTVRFIVSFVLFLKKKDI